MNDHYQGALERVVNLIERSLSDPLILDELSNEAGFSKFHLHAQVVCATGALYTRKFGQRRL